MVRDAAFNNSTMAKWGVLSCWLAVIIYAASNSVVTMLVNIGDANRINGHNVITFANLLVLGSLISLIPMSLAFGRDWELTKLRGLSSREWVLLTVSAVLSSAVTPGLYFFALENTSVTNVVIAGRIDPPTFLVLAAIFLGERFDFRAMAGNLIILVGAVVILAFKDDDIGHTIGLGEVAALVATLSFTVSTIITRTSLQTVPFGVFPIFRTVVGTLIYVCFQIGFSGHHHFGEMLQPILLKWIWVYVILIIIIGQLAWNLGLKHAKAGDVSLATSFSPLAAIAIAMVILNEDPGSGLIPGGVLMVFGIWVARSGRKSAVRKRESARKKSLELEKDVNFKGV
ncbi:hypothetical protein XM52_28285 [Roseovarius indicus]|uniref:EamA domain-containing protein n=3 Tax=Roseovarius indicus TaxID=540747 RepID=A0A0T5NTH8_9RHOB|nr:hypothetical protein XM52_28285 [Roseovarius indicus]